MRIRRFVVGLAVTLLAAAAAGVAVAATRSADITRPQRIHVIELPTQQTFTDLNAHGFSQGDLFVSANNLVDPRNHARVVGHEDDTCTVMSASLGRLECTGTAFFAGGSVMIHGPFIEGHTTRLAVIGGTGRYRNARGQAVITDLGQARSDNTYQLIP
jgi:hypothetical protein